MLKPLALAATLLALPALAQVGATTTAPNMRPSRDVAVTYRLTGAPGMAPQDIRMAWSGGRQRVDPPGGVGWMLIDRAANTAVMVMDAQRMVMTLPSEAVAAMTQDMPAGARYARKGSASIAGQGCTEWEVTIPQGASTVCLTEDGVMLRAVTALPNNGGTTRMEASEVRYGAQEAARFTVPPGYQAMPAPAMPGQAPGQPPAK